MGIGSGQALLLKIMMDLDKSKSRGSVCELGSQVPLKEELIDLIDNLNKVKLNGDYSAKELYLALGYKEYVSIDINGEHESLKFDLNKNLSSEYSYEDTFNIITNFGTSEHCFNQFSVFHNIHSLCKKNGFMLHTVPAQGWGGHCFFRYDVNFFQDLCKANNYKLIFLKPFLRLKPYAGQFDKSLAHLIKMCNFLESEVAEFKKNKNNSCDPYYKNNAINDTLFNLGCGGSLFNITLGCVYQKLDPSDFVIPIQGMYQKDNFPHD